MKLNSKYIKVSLYLLGLSILGILMYNYGLDTIWNQLKETSWWFIPILVLWYFVYLLNTISWNYIIKSSGEKLSFGKLFGLIVSGYAINYVTPFVSLGGEPYRIFHLKQYMSGTKAATVVLQYSMMHMYSHVWFWILGLVIMIVDLGFGRDNYPIIFGSLAFILVLFFFFNNLFRKGFILPAFIFLKKIPILRKVHGKYSDKEDYLRDLDVKISDLFNNNKSAFYKSLTSEFSSRILSSLEFLLILKAIGIEISIFDAIYISAASSLIANIMFFMPMQLGTREGGLAFVIRSIGLDAGLGIFISLVTRIREFAWIITAFIIMPFIKKKELG